jgi:hypothetical protein
MRRLYGLDGAEDFSGHVGASQAQSLAHAQLPAGAEESSKQPTGVKLEAAFGRGGPQLASPSAARPPLAPIPSPSPVGRPPRSSNLSADLQAAAEPEDDLINWSQKLDMQGIDELRLSDSFSRFNF